MCCGCECCVSCQLLSLVLQQGCYLLWQQQCTAQWLVPHQPHGAHAPWFLQSQPWRRRGRPGVADPGPARRPSDTAAQPVDIPGGLVKDRMEGRLRRASAARHSAMVQLWHACSQCCGRTLYLMGTSAPVRGAALTGCPPLLSVLPVGHGARNHRNQLQPGGLAQGGDCLSAGALAHALLVTEEAMQPDQRHSAMAAMGCSPHLAAGCQQANPAVLHHANPASGAAQQPSERCCPSLLPMPAAHACCPQVPGIKPEFAEAVLSAQQDPFFKANM